MPRNTAGSAVASPTQAARAQGTVQGAIRTHADDGALRNAKAPSFLVRLSRIVGQRFRGGVHALWGFALPIVLVAVWEWLSQAGVIPPWQLPAPSDVYYTLLDLHASGDLWAHAAISVSRVLIGFAIGAVLGATIGIGVALSKSIERFVDTSLQAIKSVPTLGWVPLLILWFGIGEPSKLTLIAIGSFFPVYVNVIAGVRGVDRALIEVGECHSLTRLGLITRIILPAASPSFLTGIRVGLTQAWLFMVIAELMAADKGLGFLLTVGREVGRPDLLLCSLGVLAVLGKLTDTFVKTIESRLLSWRDTVEG